MRKKDIVSALKEEFNIENEKQLNDRIVYLHKYGWKDDDQKKNSFELSILLWYRDKLHAFAKLKDNIFKPLNEFALNLQFKMLKHGIEKEYGR